MCSKAFALIALCAIAVQLTAGGNPQGLPATAQATRSRRAQAVLQAIKDEIYDHGYGKDYAPLQTGPGVATIPVYINPYNYQASVSDAIYKLMPIGEVDRQFILQPNGLAVLGGDPANGFPPNGGPSMKTLYLSDSFVLHAKLHWEKYYVTVLFDPAPAIVLKSAERQKQRTGFSYYLYSLSHPKTKTRPPADRN